MAPTAPSRRAASNTPTCVNVEPITEKEKLYATVIGTEPVRETSTTSTPREVCEDVVVQERAARSATATSAAPSPAR